MDTITAVFGAIKEFFGWTTQRSTLKNAADVKAAQARQDELDAVAKTNEALKQKDINEIRKELSE